MVDASALVSDEVSNTEVVSDVRDSCLFAASALCTFTDTISWVSAAQPSVEVSELDALSSSWPSFFDSSTVTLRSCYFDLVLFSLQPSSRVTSRLHPICTFRAALSANRNEARHRYPLATRTTSIFFNRPSARMSLSSSPRLKLSPAIRRTPEKHEERRKRTDGRGRAPTTQRCARLSFLF